MALATELASADTNLLVSYMRSLTTVQILVEYTKLHVNTSDFYVYDN